MIKKKPVFEGKVRLKKGDEVVILSGKDKGKRGKIIETVATQNRVRVEGINVVKKHQKPRGTSSRAMLRQQTGEIEFPLAIPVSKVMLICPHCSKETRVASGSGTDGSLGRKCRKCGQMIDG